MFKTLLGVTLLMGPVVTFSQNYTEKTFPDLAKADRDTYRPHMGLNAGVNTVEGGETAPEMGVNVGFQPYIPFGFEAELSTSRYETVDDVEHQRVSLLGRGTYNFGGEIPVIRSSYVGVGAGPVFFGGETQLGFAPTAGFDIPLTEKMSEAVSLGLNAKYMVITNASDSFIASAAVKYWF